LQSVALVAEVQLALQDAVEHRYAPQLPVVAVAQVPRPSQNEVGVNEVPLHVAAAHTVDVPGAAPQLVRDESSHLAWQAPVPLQAGRVPRGGPESTGVQVPSLPETLQASHWPVHALLQHTPSTQWPLPHSASAAHVAASGLLQVPRPFASQRRPALQEATLQHTPSTQWTLPHWLSAVHVVPAPPVDAQVVPLQK
jgi:hypothetical protein